MEKGSFWNWDVVLRGTGPTERLVPAAMYPPTDLNCHLPHNIELDPCRLILSHRVVVIDNHWDMGSHCSQHIRLRVWAASACSPTPHAHTSSWPKISDWSRLLHEKPFQLQTYPLMIHTLQRRL